MDKKQAKIHYIINQNTNLTKLDIKNKTGYSMSTVLNCVKRLEEQKYITCGIRQSKGGKAPSVINANPFSYVIGIGYSSGFLRGVRQDLKGNVEELLEEEVEETKENIDNMIKKLTKLKQPCALGIITENLEYSYQENKNSNIKRNVGTIQEGLACFYRFFLLKNNLEIAIIYIDEDITLMKAGECISYYDISSLFSPILHAEKGRLTYREVLAKHEVKTRLNEKFSLTLDELETSADINVQAYKNRLVLAVSELINIVEKLLQTRVIIIGGYLPLKNLENKKSTYGTSIYFAGDIKPTVAHLASAMAIESLFYYD